MRVVVTVELDVDQDAWRERFNPTDLTADVADLVMELVGNSRNHDLFTIATVQAC